MDSSRFVRGTKKMLIMRDLRVYNLYHPCTKIIVSDAHFLYNKMTRDNSLKNS